MLCFNEKGHLVWQKRFTLPWRCFVFAYLPFLFSPQRKERGKETRKPNQSTKKHSSFTLCFSFSWTYSFIA